LDHCGIRIRIEDHDPFFGQVFAGFYVAGDHGFQPTDLLLTSTHVQLLIQDGTLLGLSFGITTIGEATGFATLRAMAAGRLELSGMTFGGLSFAIARWIA
jgi:hypothetical protein